MGKTYRRDSQYKPKKHGRIFTKDPSWKKGKKFKPNEVVDASQVVDVLEPPEELQNQ